MFKQGDDRFYLGDPQRPDAEIIFEEIREGVLSVSHTYVSESLRGQGVAGRLLDAVAELARSEGKKLSATCSYARQKLETDEKYADIAL